MILLPTRAVSIKRKNLPTYSYKNKEGRVIYSAFFVFAFFVFASLLKALKQAKVKTL
ncbi:exported hypothetical protein [Alteromonas alvinellae]